MNAALKAYPEYLNSGLPWVGTIPAHWTTQRAKWLFTKMQRPVRPEDETVTCFRDGVVTLRKNRRTTGFTESLKEIGYQGVRRGDLVIHAMDAFAGAVGVSDSDGKSTPVYAICEPKSGISAEYYAHLVREMARTQFIAALARGIRERSTDFRFDTFADQRLPLPPHDEQVKISKFVAQVDSRVRRLIRAKQWLIALLNEQKQAIIQRAVTRGLDPDVRLKPSGVEWLGDVPEHWAVSSLKRFASEYCDGPFGSGLKSAHYVERGVRVIRLQNIGSGEFRSGSSAFISHAHYSTLGNHDVHEGDLIVAGLGDSGIPAGRACIAPSELGPAMVKADCFRFRLRTEKVFPQFLAQQLSATAVGASAVLSSGATRQRVNLQSMSARRVAIPPLAEQMEICSYITQEAKPIDDAIQRARHEIGLIREYRTRLIADVVTGKLDVRNVELLTDGADPGLEWDDDAEDGVDETDIAEFADAND